MKLIKQQIRSILFESFKSNISIDYLGDLIEKELPVKVFVGWKRGIDKGKEGLVPVISIPLGRSGNEIVIDEREINFDIWGKNYPKIYIFDKTHEEVVELIRGPIMDAKKDDTEEGGYHDLEGTEPYKLDLRDLSLNDE